MGWKVAGSQANLEDFFFSHQDVSSLSLSHSGVNCLAYDEAIMAQQDRIQQEVSAQQPRGGPVCVLVQVIDNKL